MKRCAMWKPSGIEGNLMKLRGYLITPFKSGRSTLTCWHPMMGKRGFYFKSMILSWNVVEHLTRFTKTGGEPIAKRSETC